MTPPQNEGTNDDGGGDTQEEDQSGYKGKDPLVHYNFVSLACTRHKKKKEI